MESLKPVDVDKADSEVSEVGYDEIFEKIIEFPLAPMGVFDPVSAHVGHSAQPPIDTSGNFPPRVSAESISPNFPIFRSK